ncbi:hypothetical protein ACWGHD_19120 [Streptomyces xanthophaeus]
MGVFDGGTYRVSVLRKDGDEEDEYTSDPGPLVDSMRRDPTVKAVETHAVHFVTGAYEADFSFGNFDEDEEDDA